MQLYSSFFLVRVSNGREKISPLRNLHGSVFFFPYQILISTWILCLIVSMTCIKNEFWANAREVPKPRDVVDNCEKGSHGESSCSEMITHFDTHSERP